MVFLDSRAVIVIFVVVVAMASSSLETSHSPARSSSDACSVKCAGVKRRTVCASDGKSYSSSCEILRLNQCEGRRLTRIDCPATGVYRPMSNSRPANDCSESLKKEFITNLLKLFNAEFTNLLADEQARAGTKGEGATTGTLSRTQGERGEGATTDTLSRTQGEMLVHWKFINLDKNGDGELQSSELRNLKRDMRNLMKQSECSREFLERCDRNGDSQISSQEWFRCIGNNIDRSLLSFLLLKKGSSDTRMNGWRPDMLSTTDSRWTADGDEKQSRPALPGSRDVPLLPSNKDNLQRNHNEQFAGKQLCGNADQFIVLTKLTCMDARASALRQQQCRELKFVPECQANGKFQREQCYLQAGSCWCVDEDTGEPVHGTVVHGWVRPTCSSLVIVEVETVGMAAAQNDEREDGLSDRERAMTGGCLNRKAFLSEISLALVKEIIDLGSSLSDLSRQGAAVSMTEKAIQWKAAQLDKNQDNLIDSREEHDLRRSLYASKRLAPFRACWHGFFHHCDRNGNADGQLTVSEFVRCFNVEATSSLPLRHHGNPNATTRGREQQFNPFLLALKPLLSARR